MNTSARSAIRNRLLERRRSVSHDSAVMAAERVAPQVVAQIELGCSRSNGVVAGYLALPGEISPAPAIEMLLARGWSVVLPVCGSAGHMEFCPWSPGEDLVVGSFGVSEPTTLPVAADSIDALVIPGVAFDRIGNRVGHGVGFYDRFLDRCTQQSHSPYRLGLAYDFQIVELPDPEPWDIPMDSVVSPSEVIDTALCE